MSTKSQSPLTTACRFRYRGYQQNNGIREFAFEDVAEQKNIHSVFLDVDVQLLLKHHVHFQDAPQLFLKLLAGNPLTEEASDRPATRIVVSDDDLTDLLAKVEKHHTGRGKRDVYDNLAC